MAVYSERGEDKLGILCVVNEGMLAIRKLCTGPILLHQIRCGNIKVININNVGATVF